MIRAAAQADWLTVILLIVFFQIVGIGLLTDPIRGDTKPERLNIPTPNDPNGTDGSPFPTKKAAIKAAFWNKFYEQFHFSIIILADLVKKSFVSIDLALKT